jgi:magnesium chelatase subunit I
MVVGSLHGRPREHVGWIEGVGVGVPTRQGGDPGQRVAKISAGRAALRGVLGYEHTVMPQLENALLAGHDVIFLGERGQAKTRMIRSLTGLLDEWMPIVAGSEINDDPYHPVSKHARDLIEPRWATRHADRLGAPRPPLRREARHPRHVDRRPHRRGRPDQGRRGPVPVRRAHAALRVGAAHEPRHLRDQRAARPRRADPGRAAERARGARRADPRLQDPPAARRAARRVGQPRGLHEPWPHHHPAEGPLREQIRTHYPLDAELEYEIMRQEARPLSVGELAAR